MTCCIPSGQSITLPCKRSEVKRNVVHYIIEVYALGYAFGL